MPPLIDRLLVSTAEPRSAYMWPEGDPEIFVFQYWPESLTDTETPRWAEKEVPGLSHPLYQWTGGQGREISFTAIFTAEVDDDTLGANPGGSLVLPSARYTVDINAAVARLKSYIRGTYVQGSVNQATKPPPRLKLVLEGTSLGGDVEAINVILKTAPITYEAWFPNGKPRVARAELTFAEVIQHGDAADGSQIVALGRSSFQAKGQKYNFRGTVDRAG